MHNGSFYVGAVFPQTEFQSDPLAMRDFAQAVEELGFSHLVAYDHIVGVHPRSRPEEWRPFNNESEFYEPLTLFSFLSSCTSRIGFMSGVIILPQRQTALFAKQAANVDVYSNGRLRLGLGAGYIQQEYAALGVDFRTRGKQFDAQIPLLRTLWTEQAITTKVAGVTFDDVGISPLPKQRPIPMIIGGLSEAGISRAVALGDGYLSLGLKERAETFVSQLEAKLEEKDRDPTGLIVENIIDMGTFTSGRVSSSAHCVGEIEHWKRRGINGVAIHTMGMNLSGIAAHISLLQEIAAAIGLSNQNPSEW